MRKRMYLYDKCTWTYICIGMCVCVYIYTGIYIYMNYWVTFVQQKLAQHSKSTILLKMH